MSELEDINDLLSDVDPIHHDTIRHALLGLCNWYGDKAYRQLDDWFTIVYGTILQSEQVLECKREHIPFEKFDFSSLVEVKDD